MVTHTHSQTHRQAYMSVHRYIQIFTHAFTVSERKEMGGKKGGI